MGYHPTLQTPPSMRANVTMWDGQGTYNWDAYLTYDQYVTMMEGFPSSTVSGRTCTLFNLGTLSTNNHRQLLGVRINNGNPEGKPKFLYTSTMHGDEVTGMILMLRLIDELCTSTDTRIVDLVNNMDIYILPLTNPDGTYNGGNNTVNNAKRYNGNNIDLNRNYKDYYQGAHPDGNGYEDETIWTMAMGDENLFTMSANYHGGAEVMNYPWDAVYDDHADKDWYEHVCTEYVQIARQTYSSYMSGTYSDGVTSGAAWYVITGSRQDYMNAYAQCREVTIECSTSKTPAASQLPNFWNYNHNSMLAFMEQAMNGVHGFVYDAETGQPIEGVTVTVQNHDSETSFVTTHSVGDFHRPIKGGSYTLVFEKEGYCPYFIDVTVADDQRVELNNIQLTPGSCTVPNFTASTTNVSLGQSISFTDASYGEIVSWSWTFEGAMPSTSTAQNPTGINYSTAGDYDVTLTVIDAEGDSMTLTKENYIHVAETITMQDGTVTTCTGLFYDSGGPDSNYDNQLDYTMTFYPESDDSQVSITFTEFNLESGYDYLYVFNGTSTSAIQIGQYTGTTSPGTVTATNTAGALTFRFTSDYSVNKTGWVAVVSCVQLECSISATANPEVGGTFEGAGIYSLGDTCVVTAIPAQDYYFLNWTSNGMEVSTDATYSFVVDGDVDLVANFVSDSGFNITVSAYPASAGTVSGGGEYNFGEACTVTATAAEGYYFVGWFEEGELVSTSNPYTFNVISNHDFIASFTEGNMIGSGEATSQYLPSYNFYKYTLSQQIYTVEELGGAGVITSIAFYNGGAEKTRTYDFYMKSTEKSGFTSGTDWEVVSEADKVYSGSVTMAANDWTVITFSTPFVYDAMSNVVLVADDNSGAYTNSPHMSCRVFDATSQAICVYSDGTNYNPFAPSSYSGTLMNVKNQLMVTKVALEGCVNAVPAGLEVSEVTGNTAMVSWTGYSESYNVMLGIPSTETLVDEDFAEGIPTDWDNGSDHPWTVVDGHMESGNAGVSSSTSSISVTVSFPSAGTVEFDAECMGEGTSTYWDHCDFYIDDTRELYIGAGVSGWNHYSFAVTSGEHTFTWSYTKDGSVNPTGDHFAVDNVVMTSFAITWNAPVAVEEAEYTFAGLSAETDYCVKVQGVCEGSETAWSDLVFFSTTEATDVTQTVSLSSGWNWFSTNVEISMEDLKSALVEALPGATHIVIKSQSDGQATYNGSTWRGQLTTLDVTQMYRIETQTEGEMTLTGTPINPAEHPITITNGANWIGFPLSEAKSLNDAFSGFAVSGDALKSQNGLSTFNGTTWRGSFSTLEPGKGYIYKSNVQDDRTFIFGTNR